MHRREREFVKNFFKHTNWLYEPATFCFNGVKYRPDFYDQERNVFIEVSGTRQAYQAGKSKYLLFKETFPKMTLEIRNHFGELLPIKPRKKVPLNPNLAKLEEIVGSRKAVAAALGYSERRYRDFTNNKAGIPKAVELAVEALLSEHVRDPGP